ncbi:MAG TPA: hypothetical protein VNL14_15270 [Candidatus Acidoferrales bacterium]|nr:hypothetical protein [Candidatus Acidoferrales bacterium]
MRRIQKGEGLILPLFSKIKRDATGERLLGSLRHPFFSSIFFSSVGAGGCVCSAPPGAGAVEPGVSGPLGAAGADGAGGGGGGSSFFLQPAKVTVKAKKAPIDQTTTRFPIFSPPFKSLPKNLSAGFIVLHK